MSIAETIHAACISKGNSRVFTYLADGESEGACYTGLELDRLARTIAQTLGNAAAPGDRVFLDFRSGAWFVPAFLGCLYAGAVPVPAPASLRNRNVERSRSILADSEAQVILTDAPDTGLGNALPVIQVNAGMPPCDPAGYAIRGAAGDVPVLLQYTSGSTGEPKGVVITAANLAGNLAGMDEAFGMSTASVSVTWLPFHHDMGLIGSLIYPLWAGSRIVMMPPAAFLQRPRRWLDAISRYGGTHSAAPNFAYDLCVRAIPESAREGLSLSSWIVACNGAEPVRPETIRSFQNAFAPSGFRPEAMLPCYGLAESTVLVNAGKVFTGDIRIVDPETATEKAPGEEGEIWISGPSVAAGYWKREADTASVFQCRIIGRDNPYLRTGDLGLLRNGELQVTGRLKDLIIIRGTNHHPQDIEQTALASHRALAPAGAAAFSVDADGEERLVLALEIRREDWRSFDAPSIFDAIRQSVAVAHGVQVHAIVLLRPQSIPKTTSGKIQRAACRKAFLAGTLSALAAWRSPTAPASPAVSSPDLARWLSSRVAAITGVPVHEIDAGRPFIEYGIDSKDAVSLSAELEEHLGTRVSPTAAFDYPTITALAQHLSRNGSPAGQETRARAETADDAIAVIGIGCRFPGASNPDEFRDMLLQGRNAIGDIPDSRWDIDRFYDAEGLRPGTMYTRRGAFLDQVDSFDAAFFNITPREAAALDPQQRLWLEVAWEALENAGIAPTGLSGSRTGVFAGQCFDDYMRISISRGAEEIDAYTGLGSSRPAAAGRLSYLLGLHGPALHVDTSCSSSAMAVHLACQSLRSGECDTAIAGGVNLILAPETSVGLCQLRALARDGKCKTFDASADGYGRGEGCGVVILRRLEDALASGDRIEAVIRGTAANHDGHTNGFTAPSGPAQVQVIRRALENARALPSDVGYIEAHGTGTLLGDPIEINALGNVFGDRPADQPLFVGSVKTNIGHLEGAAAIAGLLKTIIAVRDGEIHPHIGMRTPNPHIAWEQLRLQVPEERISWPGQGGRRIAGLSSFGMSGTNVHIVVENAPPIVPEVREADASAQLLALSAKTPAAAQALVRAFDEHLALDGNLADICFTANTGRSHFAFRVAAVARTADEMRTALEGAKIIEVRTEAPAPAEADYRDLSRIADLYVKGAAIDWNRVHGRPCRRVPLPTYRFQRRRYWVGEDSSAVAHPLLGKRMSQAAHLPDHLVWQSELDLKRLSFLNGHRIHGSTLMPVSAFIEMARAAAREGLSYSHSKLADLQLHRALVLPSAGTRTVQVTLIRNTQGNATFHASSRPDPASQWVLHATATVRPQA